MNALMLAQNSPVSDLAVAEQLKGAAPFIFGIFLIALLAGAMWFDGRRRDQQRVPPRPEEQPKPPDHPTHIEEVREPDEDDFPHDGGRLLPYNMKTHSTHSPSKKPEAAPPPGEDSDSASGSGAQGGSGGPGGSGGASGSGGPGG
ncbi:DUF6479 family protein [Streptomyces sp. NPDC060064]|uniref:DUF6479 family protein n=1 Tax=Streptomyces sp. NPDC060064 TaxID=3347049 RepID=UPI003680AA01